MRSFALLLREDNVAVLAAISVFGSTTGHTRPSPTSDSSSGTSTLADPGRFPTPPPSLVRVYQLVGHGHAGSSVNSAINLHHASGIVIPFRR
ncbi:hypothetical protein CF326_g8938 [Tilletia indica]|nr:hypothetical protein CF326_g8938 [Tilletia indica]